MTAVVKESDIPKWSESFDIPVTDADSDLVTVQLLEQEMEAGDATTGPPLPSLTTTPK
jgi:Ca2+-dependent lipid-binding protein